jgi:hypothetical protein
MNQTADYSQGNLRDRMATKHWSGFIGPAMDFCRKREQIVANQRRGRQE